MADYRVIWQGMEQAKADHTKLMAKRGLEGHCLFILSEVQSWAAKIPDEDKGKIENAAQQTLDWLSGLDENNLVEEAEILAWQDWVVASTAPSCTGKRSGGEQNLTQEPPAGRSQQWTGSRHLRWLRALTNVPLCRRLRLRAGKIRALSLPGLASGSLLCSRSPLRWRRPQSSVRRSSRSRRSF